MRITRKYLLGEMTGPFLVGLGSFTVIVLLQRISRLADLVTRRLWQNPLRYWIVAYDRKGTGSGGLRKRDIWSIMGAAAPVPTEVPTPDAAEFLDDLRDLFRQAVEEAGGQVLH